MKMTPEFDDAPDFIRHDEQSLSVHILSGCPQKERTSSSFGLTLLYRWKATKKTESKRYPSPTGETGPSPHERQLSIMR